MKGVFTMSKTYYISNHAAKRMESRNISREKVEEILSCGQVFAGKHGCHRAKQWEHVGKSVICREVVFSKEHDVIITVMETITPASRVKDDCEIYRKKLKGYKHRKRSLAEKESDRCFREEYGYYNMRFSA